MSFSVLISVYCKEKPEYLDLCLQSLLDQTLRAGEVILVEDGQLSTQLHSVIDKYRDSLNIISVPLSKNVGLARALNEGLMHCQYDLVARMDSDDIALTDRFEKQLAFMQLNPQIAASSGLIEEFDDESQARSHRHLPLTHCELVKFAKTRNPLSHPATIFRKQAVLAVGGYPIFQNSQDYALWSLLIVRGFKLANMPDILVKMRTDSKMMSRRGIRYFINEVRLFNFQRKIGFLSYAEFFFNLSVRLVVRILPLFMKRWLYKNAR